ncbi:MAG: glycosyltransferase, partial [Acidimicrobiales bacterium]|nr:glycosyltransferase [Acidimicrobiales bacterium]
DGAVRSAEHGYCTDDNARVLVVMAREPDRGDARRLTRVCLRFVLDAQDRDGRCRNRRDRFGAWTDVGSTDDCWGRALWGLGALASHHEDPLLRVLARHGYDKSIGVRSPWPRAMAFAALGAVAVASVEPAHEPTRALLRAALEVIGTVPDAAWRWPEPRLAYANAALAEAVIAAGDALNDVAAIDRGLAMLGWLLTRETERGHLSVTPAGGCGPNDAGAAFDQQPIEAAAMADACWRAYTITGDRAWLRGVEASAAWFDGDNDSGLTMFDPDTGGAFDGLSATEVNRNQGTESTLALISTMQRSRAQQQAP